MFHKNFKKSLENVNDIIETNNLIRLLNFDDKELILFSQPDPKKRISLL